MSAETRTLLRPALSALVTDLDRAVDDRGAVVPAVEAALRPHLERVS